VAERPRAVGWETSPGSETRCGRRGSVRAARPSWGLLLLLVIITFISCNTIFDGDDDDLVSEVGTTGFVGGGGGSTATGTADDAASPSATAEPDRQLVQFGEQVIDQIM